VNADDSSRAKTREVMAAALLRTLENIGSFARETRAEVPAALPAPSEIGEGDADPLGAPLDIREVGRLIGCSAWTVRQKYVPLGLPHLRSGANGKLIFYKNQVVHWLLEQQRKGGFHK
jgi:hypothetical protein